MTKTQEKDKIYVHIFEHKSFLWESRQTYETCLYSDEKKNVTKSCDFPWFEAFVNQ